MNVNSSERFYGFGLQIRCHIFGKPTLPAELFEDNSFNFDYEKGNYNWLTISPNGNKFRISPEGNYGRRLYEVNTSNPAR